MFYSKWLYMCMPVLGAVVRSTGILYVGYEEKYQVVPNVLYNGSSGVLGYAPRGIYDSRQRGRELREYLKNTKRLIKIKNHLISIDIFIFLCYSIIRN